MKKLPSALPLAVLAVLAPVSAARAQDAPAPGPFMVVETGKAFYRLDDAVRSVNGGDATVLIAPGTYRDCAVVPQGRVAFRARTSGAAIFDGGLCEGKATLVLRGADAMVDGLLFRSDHAPDGGAGIRLEHGDLTVMNATFRGSGAGIVSGDDAGGTIRVDRSTFSGLGGCATAPDCAHALDIGRYGKLFVTRSRFERGQGGPYLRSRAARVSITDNSFDDSGGRGTGSIIDLPSGAAGLIARNIMVDGAGKADRAALIAVAAEERANPSAGLDITANSATLAPGAAYAPAFVADSSHEPLKIEGNMLGKGIRPFEAR